MPRNDIHSSRLADDSGASRVLIIDDTQSIHADFRKILTRNETSELDKSAAFLFGAAPAPTSRNHFQLDSAYQGNEGLALVQRAVREGRPYALAFVDVRMPPGWDGVETIKQLWAVDPDLQVVICTAFADYAWDDLANCLESRHSLLILKKPFDNIEVLQLADALTRKWHLNKQLNARLESLDELVQQRTQELQAANQRLSLDIAERQKTNLRILRLNRLYSVLSKINEIVVRAQSYGELTERACQALVEEGQFRMAWFGTRKPGLADIEALAFAGHEQGYLSSVKISADKNTVEGLGPVGRAMREAAVVVCNRIESDDMMKPWRSLALAREYRSIAAFPLLGPEQPLGVLAIYSGEADFFNAEEIQLLERLSADLSFAISFLRQKEDLRLRDAALQSAANSVVITDAKGVILWQNAAFGKLTGYRAEEALGQKPNILKSGHQDSEFYRRMWDCIRSGQVWHGELVNKRRDGTLYTEEMTITPVRGQCGEITHYIAIKQDTTDRKELEQQLRHSQKMEAVGLLAGGVAHDFNNMLTVIRGHTELLLMHANTLTGSAADGLKQVVAAADRASNLTRQLLTFSRKQPMQAKPTDLAEVLANLAKMLKRIIGEDIHFQCSHAPGLPPVQADTGMIEQVIINLAVNARDAMPNGGQFHVNLEKITIGGAQLQAFPEGREGDFVCLTFRDTGTGISPEVLSRIFEPFFTTKEVGKGTGLGLATVYGIVKQHGGWIQVRSKLNEGTVFSVFLPALASPALAPTTKPFESRPKGGTECVLLVEDDEAVRGLTRQLLEEFGYHVHEASSGVEAWERWQSELSQVDLLLTDVVMPGGVSGRDLAKKMVSQRPELKVIFLTGYSGDSVAFDTTFLTPAQSRFLQKPCPWHYLLAAVRETLDA